MKRCVAAAFIVCVTLIQVGCVGISPDSRFLSAGSPADNRASFIYGIGTEPSVPELNGERVFHGKKKDRRLYIREILPGIQQCEVGWWMRKDVHFAGDFTAKHGRSYALVADRTRSRLDGQRIQHTINRVYVVELLPGTRAKLVDHMNSLGGLLMMGTGRPVSWPLKKLCELDACRKVGALRAVRSDKQ
ncbi:MAG: hypothetical protein HN919_05760 [Verrucomicrobia bacterium]|jgi:hypothetical protein|nr:hypothetical protein [Verrucomicrobiota bacterium]